VRLGDENDLPDEGGAGNRGYQPQDSEHPLDVAALRADERALEFFEEILLK